VSALIDVMSPELPDTPSLIREVGSKPLFPIMSRLLRRIADWRRDRADVAALRLMADRDLRDMGLSRLDVEVISGGTYRFER
jgi:uncharacterized protein YjiS (DUF1127 family)